MPKHKDFSDKEIQKLWEERQYHLPSSIFSRNLTQGELEWGLEQERKEFFFLQKHLQHGQVVLRRLSITERDVKLSDVNRGWSFADISPDGERILDWKMFFVCKSCHNSLTIVDEYTPEVFKGI